MNLEHYKAASERTDADERALIPGFKRTYQGGIWSDAHCNDFGQGKNAGWDEQAERNRDLEHESRETDEREASGYWEGENQ